MGASQTVTGIGLISFPLIFSGQLHPCPRLCHISVDISKTLYLQLKPLSRSRPIIQEETPKAPQTQNFLSLRILCQFLIDCFSSPNPFFIVFSVIVELDPVNLSPLPAGWMSEESVEGHPTGGRAVSSIAPSP